MPKSSAYASPGRGAANARPQKKPSASRAQSPGTGNGCRRRPKPQLIFFSPCASSGPFGQRKPVKR